MRSLAHALVLGALNANPSLALACARFTRAQLWMIITPALVVLGLGIAVARYMSRGKETLLRQQSVQISEQRRTLVKMKEQLTLLQQYTQQEREMLLSRKGKFQDSIERYVRAQPIRLPASAVE
jgi:hypothetical protein